MGDVRDEEASGEIDEVADVAKLIPELLGLVRKSYGKTAGGKEGAFEKSSSMKRLKNGSSEVDACCMDAVEKNGGGVSGMLWKGKGERGEADDWEPDALRAGCTGALSASRLKKSSSDGSNESWRDSMAAGRDKRWLE